MGNKPSNKRSNNKNRPQKRNTPPPHEPQASQRFFRQNNENTHYNPNLAPTNPNPPTGFAQGGPAKANDARDGLQNTQQHAYMPHAGGRIGADGVLVPPPLNTGLGKKKAFAGSQARRNDPWYVHVMDAIKHKAWKSIQFIPNEQVGTRFALKLVECMNVKGYIGEEGKDQRDRWASLYTRFSVCCHNAHRSTVVNRMKGVCDKLFATNKKLYPVEDVVRMLIRDFDPQDKDDFPIMEWYWTELIPAATGNTKDWGSNTYLFNCMSNAAPPNDPEKLYVTPAIEAFAVMMYEGNATKFEKQAEIKKQYPKKKQVILLCDPLDKKKDIAEDRVSLWLIGPFDTLLRYLLD